MNSITGTQQRLSVVSPPLDQPLPPDVIAGMTWGPFRYRRYPVFSLPWLLWRTVFAVVVLVLYGGLAALGQLAMGDDWKNCALTSAYFVVGGVLMVSAGPALASFIRYRRWMPQAEALCIIAAVVVGFASAGMADYWSSMGIKDTMKPKEVPEAERKISDLDRAKIGIFDTLGGVLYFAVGGGMASLAYFSERRRLRARHEHMARLESDMRLAVLQAQIEPHFLFNSLASIRPLIRQDSAQAEAALDALADHLRATIPQMRAQSPSGFSTLGQQVDICASYLTVMRVRMGSRLQVDINVPDDLRTREFPPMMLISLVENAIKHGIEPKPGPGRILIQATAAHSVLKVAVLDDGAGLRDGLSSGLGLANIREQLEVRFGARARLAVAARPEGGTVAEISLPLTSPPAA